jgi:hypothetical protein
MKKGLDLGGMIDIAAAPKKTGIPQRGASQKRVKAERRSDQMPIRMKPSTRKRIEALAEGEPIAEIVERAVNAYKPG